MKRPIPTTNDQWLDEILLAWADAKESIPFGAAIGHDFGEAKLFHLAPVIALKFRGRRQTGKKAEEVTKTALANYIANSDPEGVDHGLESRPMLAFALTYVTAHYALDLIEEEDARSILLHCEALHGTACDVELDNVWFFQCRRSLIRAKSGDQRSVPDPHAHVAVEHEADAAEHLLLGEATAAFDRLADTVGK